MPVQAHISISFVADTAGDVEAAVTDLNAPEGAQVSATATEQVATGTVEAGVLVAPTVAGSEPLPELPENGGEPG